MHKLRVGNYVGVLWFVFENYVLFRDLPENYSLGDRPQEVGSEGLS